MDRTSKEHLVILRRSTCKLLRFALWLLVAALPVFAVVDYLTLDYLGESGRGAYVGTDLVIAAFYGTLLWLAYRRPRFFRRHIFGLHTLVIAVIFISQLALLYVTGKSELYILVLIQLGTAVLIQLPGRLNYFVVFTQIAAAMFVLWYLEGRPLVVLLPLQLAVALCVTIILVFKKLFFQSRLEVIHQNTKLALSNRLVNEKNLEIEQNYRDLQNTRRNLEDAVRSKNEFVATLSTEFRGPLTELVGFADRISTGKLDDNQKQYVEQIRGASHRLVRTVNSILDLTKIESGKFPPKLDHFHLLQVVERILIPLKLAARERGITIELDITPEIPVHLLGDSHQLIQIISNLTNNALKFTPKAGQIRIGVRRTAVIDSETIEIEFRISDSGIGVPKEKQARIFEPFFQAKAPDQDSGAGLGLNIVENLVKMMDGTVGLKSPSYLGNSEYPGAEFYVRLPFKVIHHDSRPDGIRIPKLADPDKINILLAEDNRVNQLLIGKMIEHLGYQVTSVNDGKAALAEIKEGNYQLAFVDIDLPRLSGFETAEAIRDWERSTGQTALPIVALTAHTSGYDMRDSLRRGMNMHLTKPVSMRQLKKAIDFVLGAAAN